MPGKGRMTEAQRPYRRAERTGGEDAPRAAARFPLMDGAPAKNGDPPIESHSEAPRSRHGRRADGEP
jgi:hypothetical protein